MKRLLSFPPISFTLEAFSTYGRCGVAQAAAALSYFLILTLFPLLMCVNYFIGLFHLSLEQLLSGLDQVLPDQALAVMQDYLAYASLNQSPAIVAAALVAIALSASAGLRALLLAMDKLYGLEHPGGLRRIALSVILSLLFLLTIYLSVVVIFTGDWFFHLLETHLPHPLLRLIPLSALSSLWLWIRYLLLFCFVLLLVLAIYRLGTPRRFRQQPEAAAQFPLHRRLTGGRLSSVLLVHRPVLPLLHAVRLSGLPHHPSGVALLLRQRAPAGRPAQSGVGSTPGTASQHRLIDPTSLSYKKTPPVLFSKQAGLFTVKGSGSGTG